MQGTTVALVFACMALAQASHDCNMKSNQYPPSPSRALEWRTLDLSEPAETRWCSIVEPHTADVQAMIDTVTSIIPEKWLKPALEHLDNHVDALLDSFPRDYGREIHGLANCTGIDKSLLVIYNIAYEIFGACTSIVSQDAEGRVFHARNLDFGIFPAFDKQNKTWELTERLRPLLYNIHVVNGSRALYNTTAFVGYVGVLTGSRPGGLSISVDTRFDDQLDKGLVHYLEGNHTGHFISFTTREALEEAADFDAAVAMLSSVPMVGPSYLIVGGINSGQGAIITREGAETLDVWTLASEVKNNTNWILETNYDHWKKAPFFDDRRDPANACMKQLTPAGVSFSGLFNVLSAQPNLNQLTTYTTLMRPATGEFEAYKQYCPHPCTPV